MCSPEIPNSHRVRFCTRFDFCAPGCDWNENYRGRRKRPALSQCIVPTRCIYNFTQSSPFFRSRHIYNTGGVSFECNLFIVEVVKGYGTMWWLLLICKFMFEEYFWHFIRALVIAEVHGRKCSSMILSSQILIGMFEYNIVLHLFGGCLFSRVL